MNQSIISKLRQKVDLNEETFGFINFFKSFENNESFYLNRSSVDNSGIFIVSTSYTQNVGNEWTGFVAKIQKTIKAECKTLKDSVMTGVKAEVNELKKLIKE